MESIRVATVQMESQPLDVAANLDKAAAFAAKAAEAGAQVVALPECCVSSYMPLADLSAEQLAEVAEPVPDGPSTRRLLAVAAENDLAVAAGLAERDADGRVYNTYVFAAPDGSVRRFRKFHPFVNAAMRPGDEYVAFDYLGWRFGILICYDNNQPENGRVMATMGTQVLLAPHQTGAFPIAYAGMGLIDRAVWDRRADDPDALRAELVGPKGREWLMRWLPSRAYDNGCYLVFANGVGPDGPEVRTGNAMVLDPHGRVAAETDAPDDDMVVADLDPAALAHNLGRSHLRTRRPELYAPLAEPPADRLDTKAGRDAAIADEA